MPVKAFFDNEKLTAKFPHSPTPQMPTILR